jgi:hypothetical protein
VRGGGGPLSTEAENVVRAEFAHVPVPAGERAAMKDMLGTTSDVSKAVVAARSALAPVSIRKVLS